MFALGDGTCSTTYLVTVFVSLNFHRRRVLTYQCLGSWSFHTSSPGVLPGLYPIPRDPSPSHGVEGLPTMTWTRNLLFFLDYFVLGPSSHRFYFSFILHVRPPSFLPDVALVWSILPTNQLNPPPRPLHTSRLPFSGI